MGFFDFFKQANINQGIEEYKRTAGAVLLDVRTPQEYQEAVSYTHLDVYKRQILHYLPPSF